MQSIDTNSIKPFTIKGKIITLQSPQLEYENFKQHYATFIRPINSIAIGRSEDPYVSHQSTTIRLVDSQFRQRRKNICLHPACL